MDSRRRMVCRVLEGELSVSAAAREAGVSRQTAHLWVRRAREEGLAEMSERSRRPHRIPRSAPEEIARQVLELGAEHPYWGPQKLHRLLWPEDAPVCERTVARILSRAGRTVARPAAGAATTRFEREDSNELWQVDFKKVGPRKTRRDSLSVLDDAHRFCLALTVVPDQTLASVWAVLWDLFAEYGMPLQILSDNGSAFRNNATWRWSSFDLNLMLLDIRPLHGRPYHPQTQGKVERLHGTMEREIRFDPRGDVQAQLNTFRNRYNWIRPHQSIGLRTPGSLYQPSSRPRPKKMPEPFFPEGAILRKVQDPGTITYKGIYYVLGRAFIGKPVGILQDANGVLQIVWGNQTLGPLQDLKA